MEKEDTKYMQRCLELAEKAEGLTWPNPMVGAVIVHEGRIIGEGYHLRCGGPHAEVIAINSVSDKEKLKHSTLYVNLEPCSHYGKTPPCTDLILTHSIPRVVTGTVDTSDKVSGKGIATLSNAGVEVVTGICEDDCRRLNRRFFTYHEKKRPYITLKWAQSADRYLDIIRTENQSQVPNWITGKPERILVHRWRAAEETILVGAGTIRADDPKLNVREWGGNNPRRLILSGSGIIDKNASILKGDQVTLIFTDNYNVEIPGAKIIRLEKNIPACKNIAQYLFGSGIQSMLVEGGAMVLNHFISNGLWDEARIFTGQECFKDGVKAPEIFGKLYRRTIFRSSVLEIYLNQSGA